MNYELLVERAPGDWVRLDLGDETPAMVLQINDLNQLNTRQASYSQALKLPITADNCEIFGFADEFAAKSTVPYVIRRCVLYCGGLVVAGTSFRLELRKVSSTFECQIVSNAHDLFDVLAAKTMSEISGFNEPFTWEIQDVLNQNGAFPNYGRKYFAAASSQSGITTGGKFEFPFSETDAGGRTGLLAFLFPYYPLLETVKQLLADEGYALDTDIEQIAGYTKAFFSLPNLKPGGDSFTNLTTYRRCGGQVAASGTTFPVPLSRIDIGGVNRFNEWTTKAITNSNEDESLPILYVMEYTSPGAIKIRLQCQTIGDTTAATNAAYIRYRVRKRAHYINADGSGSFDEIISETNMDGTIEDNETPFGGTVWTTDEIELAPGERVFVEAYLNQVKEAGIGSSYTTTINVLIDHEQNSVCPGGKIYPGQSTDFATQLDFLKMFIQLYGLFIDVDEDAKTFRAYTFDYFYRRIAAADFADWSDKIDVSDAHTTTFKVGSYAQDNNILFANNSTQAFQDKGTIVVDNANLAATKDLFTVSVESTGTENVWVYPGGAGNVAAEISDRLIAEKGARFLNYKDDLNDGPTYQYWQPNVKVNSAKTHIVRRSAIFPDNWLSAISYIPQRGATNVPFTVCTPLTPGYFVSNFYNPLTQILNPARVVEAYFYLTPDDIANIDLMRPVYIEQYGEYFYIQKVDNFMFNRLTKCTLVSLNYTNN